MYSAPVLSIENGHDEIYFLLIDAGADLLGDGVSSRRRSPLSAAVRQRNARMVRIILDASTGGWNLDRSLNNDLFGELLQWGDRSLIRDLVRAFSGESIGQLNVSTLGKGVITRLANKQSNQADLTIFSNILTYAS